MLTRYHKRMSSAKEKLGNKCAVCSSPDGLQLDHIDPSTKSFTIGKLSSCSEQKFWVEVAKCQLLCQPCHAEKTRRELGQQDARKTHGTLSSYRYCRCERCRASMAEYCRKRRAGSSTAERLPFKQNVVGAAPTRPTNEM